MPEVPLVMSRSLSPAPIARRRAAYRWAQRHRARRTLFFCLLAVLATLWAAGLPGRIRPEATTTAPAESDTIAMGSSAAPTGDEDARRQAILSNTGGTWPESLRDLLERHPDALTFVEGYPDHKDDPPAETIGDVVQGQFPLLLQWDPRWGYVRYGDDLLAVTGCGPTCLAMAGAGLTGDNTITPAAVAEKAQRDGYWVDGVTSWELMRTGCEAWGLASEELPLSESAVTGALNDGRPIICSVRPGDFTTTGHFILLAGVEEGGIRVNDPNSPQNSDCLWSYAELEPQIRNLWAFSVR